MAEEYVLVIWRCVFMINGVRLTEAVYRMRPHKG